MNRALRAATMGALLLTPVVLTACSAGQVNQTASQDRDKVGPQAEVGDLELRQITLANPCEADEEATAYEEGDSPELVLSIANGGREDDTLTGISGDVFEGVYVDELPGETAATSAAAVTTPAAPSTPAEQAPTTPSTTETPSGSQTTETPTGSEAPATGAAPTSAAPTPPAPTTEAAPTPSTRLDVAVPGGAVTNIGLRQYEEGRPCEPEVAEEATRLFLADLSVDAPLTASQSITLTLTFENAGEVTVQALVAGPGGAVERGEGFDFHGEEGAEANDEQDTEAE